MIPKRVIYCWFGGKEKPKEVLECIDTWKEHLKGWEFLEINEDNFKVFYNDYSKKAYLNKKWAYVSDIARLWALYNYGGVYMDTDVKVIQPLDKFLKYDFFSGFEQVHYPITATMGAIKGSPLIKEMLDYYKDKKFELYDNWQDYETNTMIMSNILGQYFDRDKVELQIIDNMAIYPIETFCTSDIDNKDTYTRHLMFGTWTKE